MEYLRRSLRGALDRARRRARDGAFRGGPDPTQIADVLDGPQRRPELRHPRRPGGAPPGGRRPVTADPADLLVRIRGRGRGSAAYPVEAELGDGSRFTGRRSRIDPAAPALDGHGRGVRARAVRRAVRRPDPDRLRQGARRARPSGGLRIRLQIDPDAVELEVIRWERIYRERNGTWIPVSTAGDTPVLALPGAARPPSRGRSPRCRFGSCWPSRTRRSCPPGFQPVEVRRGGRDASTTRSVPPRRPTRSMSRSSPGRADLGPTCAPAWTPTATRSSMAGRTLTRARPAAVRQPHRPFRRSRATSPTTPGPGRAEAALFLEARRRRPVRPGDRRASSWSGSPRPKPHPSLVYLSACDSGRTDDAAGPTRSSGSRRGWSTPASRPSSRCRIRVPVDDGPDADAATSTGRSSTRAGRRRAQPRPRGASSTRTRRTGRSRSCSRGCIAAGCWSSTTLANRVIADDVSLTAGARARRRRRSRGDRPGAAPAAGTGPAPAARFPGPARAARHEVQQTPEPTSSPGRWRSSTVRPARARPRCCGTWPTERGGDRARASSTSPTAASRSRTSCSTCSTRSTRPTRRSGRPTPTCGATSRLRDGHRHRRRRRATRTRIEQLIELRAAGPASCFAAVERNLWGEGRAIELEGLPGEAAVQLFERGLGRPLTADERGPERSAARCCASLGGICRWTILQAADQVARAAAPWPHARRARRRRPPRPTRGTVRTRGVAVRSAGRRMRRRRPTPSADATCGGRSPAAGAPHRLSASRRVIGQPDAAASCESLRRAGLVRTGEPPVRPRRAARRRATRCRSGVADWRSRLLAYLVRWVGQNRRSPGCCCAISTRSWRRSSGPTDADPTPQSSSSPAAPRAP